MTAYKSAAAFRRSLEDRLRARAAEASTPLDRLRKEAAGQRLLARIQQYAPPGSWALKGGLALIARMNDKARATKDIDATWREETDNLHDLLTEAVALNLDDYFEFALGLPQPIQAEGPEGGIRFKVTAVLDGREFENLQLDINLVPNDPRATDTVMVRNLFDFAGLPELCVPTISVTQHLAEKLHAYCRSYGEQINSRAKDLYDMLTIADQLQLPTANYLAAGCIETFQLRDTDWPPTIPSPPVTWQRAWDGFVADYGSRWETLTEAFAALISFWQPVHTEHSEELVWNAEAWTWQLANPEFHERLHASVKRNETILKRLAK